MDHTRVDIRSTSISCGINELSRISEDTKDAVFAVANHCNHPSRGEPATFFIASDVTDVETSTQRFMDYVEENKLGVVLKSASEINPKTGNPICIYMWTPDHKNLREFYLKTKIEKLTEKRKK